MATEAEAEAAKEALMRHIDSLKWPDEPSYAHLRERVEALEALLICCGDFIDHVLRIVGPNAVPGDIHQLRAAIAKALPA